MMPLTGVLARQCTIDVAAQLLGVDRRSVHRHLVREGQTFLGIVGAVRRELADRYMKGPPPNARRRVVAAGSLRTERTLALVTEAAWQQGVLAARAARAAQAMNRGVEAVASSRADRASADQESTAGEPDPARLRVKTRERWNRPFQARA